MTPDNAGYAIAAYSLAALVYAVYVVTLVARERALRARLDRADAARDRPDPR